MSALRGYFYDVSYDVATAPGRGSRAKKTSGKSAGYKESVIDLYSRV
jgi:hypothetical protein